MSKTQLMKKSLGLVLATALTLGSLAGTGTQAQAAGVKLNKTKLTLTVGKSATLSVKGTKAKVTWKTSDAKVASVTSKGKVTAKKIGKAVIKAKVAKKTLKCNVTVKAAKALSTNWSADSAAAKSLREYVTKVTNSKNKDGFIPKKDRIAVFDMDGTLMGENYFTYYDTMMFIEFLKDHPEKATDELKEAAAKIKPGYKADITLAQNFAKAYAGMTIDELYDYAVQFGKRYNSSFTNMRFIDGFFLPMVELVKYLYENDFTIYVVSGTERTTTRAIVAQSPIAGYVTPNHVIGTEFEVKVKGHENEQYNTDYKYADGDDLVITGGFLQKNLNANKSIYIEREIGKRPVLAFGNSGSDTSMMDYAIDKRNPYPTEAYMIINDDVDRDWPGEDWDKNSAKYNAMGYRSVSIKKEFKNLYKKGIKKAATRGTTVLSAGLEPVTWKTSSDKLLIKSDEAKALYDRLKKGDYPTVEELKDNKVTAQIDEISSYYKDIYGNTKDIDTPQRKALREDILKKYLATGSAKATSSSTADKKVYSYDGPLKKEYKMELVLGLPAAGKSSMVTDPDSEATGSFIIDPDAIKELIPEFIESNGAAADAVHFESMDITAEAIKAFTEGDMLGTNVIYPLVAPDYDELMNSYIKPFEKAGYEVTVKYVHVPFNQAFGRNIARELETGRVINSSVLLYFGDKPLEVYNRLKTEKNSKGNPYDAGYFENSFVAQGYSVRKEAAKAKKPALSVKSVTVKDGSKKTVKLKNIKKSQVRSLTVKSADKTIASVKKKNAVSIFVTGKNAYEQTKATVTVKLKKKIRGKKSYKFSLKIFVDPDRLLAAKGQRAPNYKKGSDWLHLPVNTKKKVDTFYIYPSAVSEGKTELLSIDDSSHREGAQTEYYDDATTFEYDTNVYSPYYRQTDGAIFEKKTEAELAKYQRHEPNYNKGKPFILAGTQQGSQMIDIVLEDYMKRHPEYKKRLVAVYEEEVDKDKVCTDVTAYGSSHGMDMSSEKNIEILYTNDVHCGVDAKIGYAGLYSIREELKRGGDDTVLVDNGDAVQGGPIGLLTKGESIVDLMNDVGYDVAIFGNHEFDYQIPQLFKLMDRAKTYKYISCNFTDLRTGKLVADPSKIMEVGGKKIAFIGATTPGTILGSTPKYFQDDKGNYIYGFKGGSKEELYNAIQAEIDAVKSKGADYVILMAHLGLDEEEAPFRSIDVIPNVSGLDIVLDGHSHTVMNCEVKKGKDGKDVLLTQTGTGLQYVGKMTITADGKISAGLVGDYHIKEPKITDAINREKAEFQEILDRKIGTVGFDMVAKNPDSSWIVRMAETNLADFIADAYRDSLGTDIGVVNAGGVRDSIPAGDITYGKLMNVHPSANNLVTYEITGKELLDVLEFSVMSLPGENGGLLHFSGITYDVDLSKKADIETDASGAFVKINGKERRISNVKIGGEPLDTEKTYTLAGQTYIIRDGGNGYSKSMFSGKLTEETKTDIEVLIDYIGKLGGVIPDSYKESQGRMHIIKA